MAAIRQPDFDCELETAFSFDPCHAGDEGGLAVVLSSQFYCRFVKKRTEEGDFLVLEKNAEDMYQRACQIPVPAGKLYLKIRADREFYHFLYSPDEERWQEAAKASTRFLACEVSGRCFTGTVMGLYAASERETEAVIRVHFFESRS